MSTRCTPPVRLGTSQEPHVELPPSSSSAPIDSDATVQFAETQTLLGRVEEAVRDNLTRGYLESEERFRQIAEALNDMVTLSGEKNTRLFFVNAAYERIWGRLREDLHENPLALLDGVHPDDRERVSIAFLNWPPTEFDLEFRVLRPNGDQRWVWGRGFPVRNAIGEIYRLASVIEDITERKLVVESHERLIRGFTHDLRNPLGAANGYLSLLEDGVFGAMTAAQMEAVGRARQSIHTALELVTQLLDIERAEAGQLKFERERLDIAAITRECVEGFRASAEAKHLALALFVDGDEASLAIESDRARVRQVLSNLISNAVKYTQTGGSVEIRVQADGADVPPRIGQWLAVSISDNGPGIPLEKQNMLFREFTRFNPGAAEGSGIGLAISQRVARALGAVITCRSTPGAGSTFTLWLPSDA